ncbi:hypothetical protein DAKH74_008170 [Maudiozyma humilis]|uniref:Uncharacterized protein n=1 Tax=Maudiozyma humilis TaxID=51915 RepID=A0AAV5RSP3_MAUHU|nr:hypothetical protein DAKH74_008170 [Kazachstania humilis]
MPLGNYHRAIAIVPPHPPEIYARKEGGSPPPPGPPPPLATGISKLSTMPDRSQKQLPLWDAPPPRRRCHPPPTGRPYACASVSVRVSVRASSLRAVLSRTIPKPRGAQREPGSEAARQRDGSSASASGSATGAAACARVSARPRPRVMLSD